MIKFYTIHCPACNVLKKKLDEKNLTYEEITDKEIMIEKGFKSMPMLEVDDKVLTYIEAVNWLKTL